jgi:hypothetical protein
MVFFCAYNQVRGSVRRDEVGRAMMRGLTIGPVSGERAELSRGGWRSGLRPWLPFQDGDAAPSGCATVVHELQRGKMQQ